MRALAIVAALLVLATPLVGAQSEDPSSSSSSSSSSPSPAPRPERPEEEGNRSAADPDDDPSPPQDDEVECPEDRPFRDMSAQEQKACFCERQPRADGCSRDEPEDADARAGEWRRWCRDEARDDAQRERCRQALDDFRSEQGDGRPSRVAFEVDAANRSLLNYSIDGRPVFDAIVLDTGSDNLTVRRLGSALRLGDADTELVLHDDPTGLVRFKGDDGSVTVRLADGIEASPDASGGLARVRFPDGALGHLRAGNATWLDESTLLASGFFAFLLPASASEPSASDDAREEQPEEAAEAEPRVERAIADRKVGAEISVRAPSAPASALAAEDAGDEDGSVQILAYDDVDVQVNVPTDVATPEAPIRIKVSAELDEGRTIVLNLDRSVLESSDRGSLVLRYFDIYDQPDGTEVQTEVVFAQAAHLQDVLDPADDAGQPEYWVVEDANGLQVLVSVPHWSAHAITVGSVLAQHPSVLLGIVVGLSGTAVAAAAMLWPRRPDDE